MQKLLFFHDDRFSKDLLDVFKALYYLSSIIMTR
jgi:hypothetical protein